MKKKILFFLIGGVGGAERVTITIAKLLDNDVYDVQFVIISAGNTDILNFIPSKFKVQIVNIRSLYFLSTLRMINILKAEKPTFVFCASPAINSRLILSAKIVGGIKVIVRNSNIFATERKDVQLLMKLTYKYADRIILQQQEMLDELLKEIKLPEGKAIALQNPIDKDAIDEKAKAPSPYPQADQVNYVWTARFAPAKGQDILAKAFVELHKVRSNAHLYFVGIYAEESEFFQKVKNTIEQAGLKDFVHFVGFDSNPYRWVKHCDCYVLPSRYEGLPNAMLEAMYLNKPCVSTLCIPIIDRMIKDGYNGYKVPNEDYMAMAEAMNKAVELKDFEMIYKSADDKEFIKIFEEL